MKMFTIEDWMFRLGISNGQILVFAYVYSCIKANSWNPKEISSAFLAKKMGKLQQNISTCLNDLCKLGLLTHSGNTSNNCCIYSLTPKVFDVSKEVPVSRQTTSTDYSEQIHQVMKKFRAVLGLDVFPIEVIEQYATPLLEARYSVNDLCNVIDCKAREWINEPSMRGYIRPQTLFGPKFSIYLNQSKVALANITKQERIEKENKEVQERAQKVIDNPELRIKEVDEVEVLFDSICEKKGWNVSGSNKAATIQKIKKSKQYEDGSIQDILESAESMLDLYRKIS